MAPIEDRWCLGRTITTFFAVAGNSPIGAARAEAGDDDRAIRTFDTAPAAAEGECRNGAVPRGWCGCARHAGIGLPLATERAPHCRQEQSSGNESSTAGRDK